MRYTHVLLSLLVAANSVSHCSDNNDVLMKARIGGSVVGISMLLVYKMYTGEKIDRLTRLNAQISNGMPRVQENYNRNLFEKYKFHSLSGQNVLPANFPKELIGLIDGYRDHQSAEQFSDQLRQHDLLWIPYGSPEVPGIAHFDKGASFAVLHDEDVTEIKNQKIGAAELYVSLDRACRRQERKIEDCREQTMYSDAGLWGICFGELLGAPIGAAVARIVHK